MSSVKIRYRAPLSCRQKKKGERSVYTGLFAFMDKQTIKLLGSTIFRKLDSHRRKLELPENYYIENISMLKDEIMTTLSKLGAVFTSDDVEILAKEVQSVMSFWMTDGDDEDELFELDIFLGDLDGVMRDVNDMFANWSSIIARKDIQEHKEDLLSDLNLLLEEIYARKTELEEVT